jgi:hypothetical protein
MKLIHVSCQNFKHDAILRLFPSTQPITALNPPYSPFLYSINYSPSVPATKIIALFNYLQTSDHFLTHPLQPAQRPRPPAPHSTCSYAHPILPPPPHPSLLQIPQIKSQTEHIPWYSIFTTHTHFCFNSFFCCTSQPTFPGNRRVVFLGKRVSFPVVRQSEQMYRRHRTINSVALGNSVVVV